MLDFWFAPFWFGPLFVGKPQSASDTALDNFGLDMLDLLQS